jgi:hypothetical protein
MNLNQRSFWFIWEIKDHPIDLDIQPTQLKITETTQITCRIIEVNYQWTPQPARNQKIFVPPGETPCLGVPPRSGSDNFNNPQNLFGTQKII